MILISRKLRAWVRITGAVKPANRRSKPVVVLDTNHLSAFERATPAGERLRDRLHSTSTDIATTIVCAEEQMKGRLAKIQALSLHPLEQIEA